MNARGNANYVQNLSNRFVFSDDIRKTPFTPIIEKAGIVLLPKKSSLMFFLEEDYYKKIDVMFISDFKPLKDYNIGANYLCEK